MDDIIDDIKQALEKS
ncbi:MAG: hypothetical protein WC324_04190 [Candidatus Omnitrophota bacterium]